eukprot:gene1053-2061_t
MAILSISILLFCCLSVSLSFFPSTSPSRLTQLRSCVLMEGMIPLNTKRIFDKFQSKEAQVGGAGGSSSLDGLIRLDKTWNDLKNGAWEREGPKIVHNHERLIEIDNNFVYDVAVAGGTLGIFYGVALQMLGYKTCVIERGLIAGRPQEWNISRKELNILLKLNILSEEDLSNIIGIEFNPVRVGFKTDTSENAIDKGFELYVQDILNLGIRPDKLIKIMKEKFTLLGGKIFENTNLNQIDIYPNIANLSILQQSSKETDVISSRLVIDSMGNASPIARQIRGPIEPSGICVVVGSCARGFSPANNTYSDVIYTDTPVTVKGTEERPSALQYFWEAFPAGSSPLDRTTYLFTYMDAKPERPSILEIMEDYWTLLPRYQGVDVDELEFLRILYGMFPTYKTSPLSSGFSRIIQVGDASGIQSPLSFGGFGSLTRHIERVVNALDEALRDDLLDRAHLSLINTYQPNLSACWMFQRAMSVRVGVQPAPGVVTDTLANTFSGMTKLGDPVLRPFLQDVVQFVPLVRSLFISLQQDPLVPIKMIPHVGILELLDFTYHMVMMALYTLLAKYISPMLLMKADGTSSPSSAFSLRRKAEAWKFAKPRPDVSQGNLLIR